MGERLIPIVLQHTLGIVLLRPHANFALSITLLVLAFAPMVTLGVRGESNAPPPPDVYGPKLIPETEMPQPYFLKYGQLSVFKNVAEEQTWLEMLTKLGAQVSGPDVSFPFSGTLVVAHGVGADGYYWIWVERSKVSHVDSSVVAGIVEFVNRSAKKIGFATEVPLKFAEATGSRGVDADGTNI